MQSTGRAGARKANPAAAVSRFFFENTDLWLAVADEEFRVVSINPAWADGFGLAADAAVGRPLDELLPAPVLQRLRELEGASPAPSSRPIFQAEAAGGRPRWFEADLKHKDGQVLVALIDVSDSKGVSPAVEEARRSRDLLLHDAGVGTWRFDPDADAYHFSPELMTAYGQETTAIPRILVESVCHPDDLVVERPVREKIVREGGFGEIELRMRAPEVKGWVHYRVLMRAGAMLPSGSYELYGLTQSITELAQARDQARANAERLKIALNAASAGVFEIDFETRTFLSSPEFVALVGREITFENVRDGTWSALHPDDLAEMQRAYAHWSETDHVSIDVRTTKAQRWIRVYCHMTRDEQGRPLRGVGLVLDIDERKRQELALETAQQAAEAATEAKSSFLASVSHEIRTPMNGIVGVLHLLKQETISDDGRKLLDEALACSGMLGQLINDVLDFSKIEAGKLELSPEPTNLPTALEGVIGLLTPQTTAKDLYLRASIEPGLEWIEVDPVRLRQCLFNLIGNAVKFTLKGGVSVRLKRAQGQRVRIEVQDTGIGISDEAKARLFQRFEQADGATTKNFSGTGLGLAISKSLAELMGGDIGVDSREGEGSTFWMEFSAPDAEAPAAAVDLGDDVSLEGLRILIVDDNATNRLIGLKILEVLGAEASAASDGQSAVDIVVREPYDLILMDINMPGMDGMEATRKIRSLDGAAAQVPIIALTANVMAHQRLTYLEAGMNGVVAKPFSPSTLLAEIVRLVQEQDEAEPRQAAG